MVCHEKIMSGVKKEITELYDDITESHFKVKVIPS